MNEEETEGLVQLLVDKVYFYKCIEGGGMNHGTLIKNEGWFKVMLLGKKSGTILVALRSC